MLVEQFLSQLEHKLPTDLFFHGVAVVSGRFLFWDIKRSRQLVVLHELSLDLSRFFVATGDQQADREGIVLSPEEDRNVRTFGHPLVQKLWRPHVTLGYYSQGISQEPHPEKFRGTAIGAAFVRIGEAGTIAERIL